MTKSKSKPKAKSPSRAGQPRQPATRSTVRELPKQPGTKAAARQIAERTQSSGDWRAAILAEVRRLIRETDPDITEERKWIKPTNPLGVAAWSHAGIICTGEVYKQVVKLTFARGAALPDPQGIFNASLDGNTRRAIDIREGESLDARAFRSLIRAAVAENVQIGKAKSRAPKANSRFKSKKLVPNENGVVLLSGGNPQIPKGYGDAPVQAYIAAMPGWKRDLGRKLDALIERTVPGVYKAVKWNTPLYGLAGQGWFLGFHVFTRFVKVTFFRGTSLQPIPPGGTPKSKESRWIDIYETDQFDEVQLARWVQQASELPGERM